MSLILVRKIQRITDFDDTNGLTSHIVVELKLVNCKKLEEKAKQIDKGNYSKDCFCIEFNYVYNDDNFYLLDDGLYYIDNDGKKNFLECNRTELINIVNSVELEFRKFLKDKEKYIKKNNVSYDVI